MVLRDIWCLFILGQFDPVNRMILLYSCNTKTTHVNFIETKNSECEKRVGDSRCRSVVEHRVHQEREVEQGHAGRDSLASGESGSDGSGEDRPPEVIVGEFPVAAGPENETRSERFVFVLRQIKEL